MTKTGHEFHNERCSYAELQLIENNKNCDRKLNNNLKLEQVDVLSQLNKSMSTSEQLMTDKQ